MPRIDPLRATKVEERAAARIRRERAKSGQSVRGLAELVAAAGAPISGQAVSKIESGTRRITLDELAAFASVFGLSTDDLLGVRKGQRR